MDDIYSQLIFRTPAQRIEYYKERDDTVNRYKEKLQQVSSQLAQSTGQISSKLGKNTFMLESIIKMMNGIDKARNIKSEKDQKLIKELQDRIQQLEKENVRKDTEITALQNLTNKEKDAKPQKFVR
jgi:hypothetical protein